MTPTDVELALPTWDFGQSLDLVDPLMAVGLRLAFDDDRADFSNITTEIPLVLSGRPRGRHHRRRGWHGGGGGVGGGRR